MSKEIFPFDNNDFKVRNKTFFIEAIKLYAQEELNKQGYCYLSGKEINKIVDFSAIRQDNTNNISEDEVLEELHKLWNGKELHIESRLIYNSNVQCKSINSVEKLLHHINEYKKNYNKRLYFRGHNNFSYRLVPSLFRNDNLKNNEENMKNEVLRHFLNLQSLKDIDLMAHFQHFGLPTKLLDLTENPLVGLFFACFADSDIESKNEDGRFFIFKEDYRKTIINNLESPCKNFNDWIYLKTDFVNDRIENQKGLFIYCTEGVEVKDSLENDDKTVIIIPKTSKECILEELRTFGIDEFFIYPEFEHFCKAIKQKYS